MNNNLTWFGRTALASLVIASITASNIDKNDINYAHVAVPEFIIVANLIIGLILIYFRRDVHVINEDWNLVKAKQNKALLFFTMLMVFLILPFSIPYSLAHFRKN